MAEPALPRVLLVDDDPDLGRLVQHVLRSHGYEPALQVTTGREALASLDGVDIVLLDQQLPDTSGLDVLDAIRSGPAPPAVVLVTGHGNESLVASALRRGADDYLAKDSALTELLPQILERVRRGRELRKALAEAEQDLVRAERFAAVGEMTVTLHHEINNPLMAAFADVELLLNDVGAPAENLKQGLEDIRQALRRIRDIVQRIGNLREVRSKDYLRGVRMVDLERKDGRSIGHATWDRVAAPARRRPDPNRLAPAPRCRLSGRTLWKYLRAPGLGRTDRCDRRFDRRWRQDARGASLEWVRRRGRSRVLARRARCRQRAAADGADHVVHLPFDPGTFTAEIVRRLTPA